MTMLGEPECQHKKTVRYHYVFLSGVVSHNIDIGLI